MMVTRDRVFKLRILIGQFPRDAKAVALQFLNDVALTKLSKIHPFQ